MNGFPLIVPTGYEVGDWTIERPLGAGAFGSVYAAARRTDDRDELPARAALKFLPTGTHTPRQLRHLRDLADREVDLLRRLRSPRLIRLYETLTVDDPAHPELDGATVLVLEEAERPLQSLLSDTAAPPPSGPALLVQICEGLHQLHTAGWVHGDLKPGNVLLMKDGSVRLGDFSTASELEGTHAYAAGFATPDYTPPELLWSEVGDRGTRIRPSADVWAFGVLTHTVLTGTSPLPGGTPTARRDAALRYARGEEELRLSPALPPVWRDIVTDCLSRTHEERVAHDARSVLRRVREAAAGRMPRRRRRGRRLVPLLAASLATLTAAGLGLNALLDRQDGRNTAAGYERCAPGYVCFFSEEGGRGEMCAWENDDPEWFDGDTVCAWARKDGPRSVFNNGAADSRGFVHVSLFAKNDLKDGLGCVRQGGRRDLALSRPIASHTWTKTCEESVAL
ncbi:serine/threonine protein kinase [Streptomyces sp. Root431]|uniref:protein kinase domain-containing protein n=1 Tax=Streptomyces sp. Root431 TaxID=1736535 RepID=UPI0006FA4E05|nr:protein kinase [Streptomyces sp. Root431]KQX10319.1 serine/threonine protein kinase [Streptomyces sp. Root431]